MCGRQKSQTDCFDDLFSDSSLLSLPLPQLMMEKETASNKQEICSEVFDIQEQLVRLQTRLEDRHQTKAQAEAKHRQAQDQLEAMKSQYSSNTSQESNARANGETVTL